MEAKRSPAIAIRPEARDVRSQAGLAVGALLAAFGAQIWVSSMTLPIATVGATGTGDESFSTSTLLAAAYLAASMVVGWICGGWMLRSQDGKPSASANPLSSFLWQLTFVGAVLLAGIAIGAWPLLGGFILVASAAIGSVARLAWEGFQFLTENY